MPPKKSVKSVPEVSTPVPVPEPVKSVVPEPVPEQVEESVVEDKFVVVLDRLQSFVNEAKELIVLVKALQRENQKLQKQSQKKSKKVDNSGVKRLPSGFAKPTKLSDSLCDFLGVEHGSSMARTIVTKHINEYIKKNSLQDEADKRHIIPDAKLKSILSSTDSDKLTYFNLQTYIKQHFKKE